MKCFYFLFLYGLYVLVNVRRSQAAVISAENGVLTEYGTFMESNSRRMRSLMNTSVDPCDDFYSYACGNYPNTIKNLETTLKRSSLYDLAFVLIDQFDAILTKPRNQSETYFEELQIAKKFVDTCSSSKLFPVQPSLEYLEVLNSIGGFPAHDADWNESTFDWFNMTAHLTRYGVTGLVEEIILPVSPFSPIYNLPKLGFGFDVSFENIARNDSAGYIYNERIMRNLLQAYGVSANKIKTTIEEIFDLWREIEKLKSQLPNDSFISLRRYCAELSVQPFENWNNFFEIAWEKKDYRISYVSYCPCRWFFNQLNELAAAKPKPFANYMALKFLFAMHPRLESAKFQRRQCISKANAAMPLLFSHFYMIEHFNKNDISHIDQMMLELQASWKHRIHSSDWLDSASHDEALKKLKNLRWHIGHIVDPISDIYIRQMRSLNLTDNVNLNILRLARFATDMRHYGNLHLNVTANTTSYDLLDATRIRAFYLFTENSIGILAGLLQPPVYHRDLPNAVKYGNLGYIIGHEIGHGFEGRGFGITSNLTRRFWLSKKSAVIANQSSNCFFDDYEAYKDPGFDQKLLNGKKVLPEIEADSAGLSVALSAYRRILKYGVKHEGDEFLREKSVPGLNLTNEQTFFLAYGQLYCAKYESRHYWNEMNVNHPADRYRVLGTLRNSEEFSKVFNCPRDSAMNPMEKCKLW